MSKLIQDLEKLEIEYKSNVSNWKTYAHAVSSSSLLTSPFLFFSSLCILCLMVTGANLQNFHYDFTVALLLLLFLIGNVALVVMICRRQHNSVLSKLLALKKTLVEFHDDLAKSKCMGKVEFSQNDTSPTLNVFSRFYSEGDESPIQYPSVLLATDDIIGLSFGEFAPCQIQCCSDTSVILKKGEQLLKSDLINVDELEQSSNALHKFRVLKSPVIEEIERYLPDTQNNCNPFPSTPTPLLVKVIRVTHHFSIAILIATLIVSIVLSALWFTFDLDPALDAQNLVLMFPDGTYSSVLLNIFVRQPVMIALPFLPITFPFIWHLLQSYGEARSLAPMLYKEYSSKVKRLFCGMLLGKDVQHSHDFSLFNSLGSVTILCCVNKEGILSWPEYCPSKIFFYTTQKKRERNYTMTSNDLSSNGGDADDTGNQTFDLFDGEQCQDESMAAADTTFSNDIPSSNHEVLSLSRGFHNATEFVFDENDWEHYMPSLKPFGLNIATLHSAEDASDIELDESQLDDVQFQYFITDVLNQQKHKLDGAQNWRPHGIIDILTEHCSCLSSLALENRYCKANSSATNFGLSMLSNAIGVDSRIKMLYSLHRVISVYKIRENSTSTCEDLGDPLLSERLNITEHSMSNRQCFSFATGIVVSYFDSDKYYLLVSGCGRLLLSKCDRYWDGKSVKAFSKDTLKKAYDFHYRSEVLGTCLSFSLLPVSKEFAMKKSIIVPCLKSIDDSTMPSSQVFLGMVSLEHQAQPDLVGLAESMDDACIRFVHFSAEDEYRSRVFAEKIGLAVGWNCHISLSNDEQNEDDHERLSGNYSPAKSRSDESIPLLNQAKLPRGIENIVPHIENVDNVPLLVPLFTDCNPSSTKQMIKVMQDYGEVVCCVGSSDSLLNFQTFAQADVSLGVKPVYLPLESSVFGSKASLDLNSEHPALRSVRCFNTFPCSAYQSDRKDMPTIYDMIKEARHSLAVAQTLLLFFFKCRVAISIVLLASHIFRFPFALTSVDVFWICFITIPVLSLSLLASPLDPDLMTWGATKNMLDNKASWKIFKHNIMIFTARFLPSCVIALVIHFLAIMSASSLLAEDVANEGMRLNSANSTQVECDSCHVIECYPGYTIVLDDKVDENFITELNTVFSYKTREAQQLSLIYLVMQFCIISIGYVHRWKGIFQSSPFANRHWLCTVLSVLIFQLLYSLIVLTVHPKAVAELASFKVSKHLTFAGGYGPAIWTLFLSTPFCLFFVNEYVKHREIKFWVRSQKRARLDFGTKLGMNSPFP